MSAAHVRSLLRRIGRPLSAAALWPLRTLLRITKDGILFVCLTGLCAIVASRASELVANVPLLICLVLCSMILSSLVLGGASLKGLAIQRRMPERAHAGEIVTVTLLVSNRGRLPAAGLVLTEKIRALPPLPPKGGPSPEGQRQAAATTQLAGKGASGQTFAVAIAGGKEERIRYSLLLRYRGVYRFAQTDLATVFPFGLWRTVAQRRVPGQFVVYPRMGELDAAFFQDLEVALQRIRRSRPSLEELDFRGLREYRHGDNPKWIHWRSTARQGRHLVKEFEEPQAKRVLLLIDTNLQRLGTRRMAAFELALSFAATAIRQLARTGCEVSCLAQPAYRPLQSATVSLERRNIDQAMELLAGLHPDNTRTLADIQAGLRRHQLRNAYLLVLGLGSLRFKTDLGWLASHDNAVKVLDVRGEEFRRIFRRAGPGVALREEDEQELLLGLGDEELEELSQEDLAAIG